MMWGGKHERCGLEMEGNPATSISRTGLALRRQQEGREALVLVFEVERFPQDHTFNLPIFILWVTHTFLKFDNDFTNTWLKLEHTLVCNTRKVYA